MKRLVALVLALVMTLSLCSVALAEEKVTAVDVAITLNNGEVPTVEETSGTYEASVYAVFAMKNGSAAPVYCGYNMPGTLEGWIDFEGESADFETVKANTDYFIWQVLLSGDGYDFSEIASAKVNGTDFTPFDEQGGPYQSNTFSYSNGGGSEGAILNIRQDVSEIDDSDDDSHFNLLSLIGAYLAVKAVGNAIKTAVVMPYVVHAMKWAAPTALAALRFGAMSRAVWHLR